MAVTWAVVLLLASVLAPAAKRDRIVLVSAGFGLGWLSATIARYVYPPPRKYRPAAGGTPQAPG